MGAALDNFLAADFPAKTVILGDMGELGADSESEHRRIVERLAQQPSLDVILVGSEFSKAAGAMTSFADTDALVEFLKANPIAGRTLLVKGSRFMKLERCIEYL